MVSVQASNLCEGSKSEGGKFYRLSSGQSDWIQQPNGSKAVRLRKMVAGRVGSSRASDVFATTINQSLSNCCRLVRNTSTCNRRIMSSSINQQRHNMNDHQQQQQALYNQTSTHNTQQVMRKTTETPTTIKMTTYSAQYHQLISSQYHTRRLKSTRHKPPAASSLISNQMARRQKIKPIKHHSLYSLQFALALAILVFLTISSGNSGRFYSCYCDKHASDKPVASLGTIQSMSDKLSAPPKVSPLTVPTLEGRRQASTSKSAAADATSAVSGQIKRSESDNSKTATLNVARHTEKLLMSLSDNIERQHMMRLSPGIRSFVLSRPSKFDSGSESLSDEPGDAQIGSNSDKRSSSSPLLSSSSSGLPTTRKTVGRIQYDDIIRQHLQSSAGSNNNDNNRKFFTSSASKADQDLRQIMMLHEQEPIGAAKAGHHQQMKQASSNSSIIGKTTASALWSLAGQPLRLDQAKTKALASVMSYLTPMASPSTTNGKQLLDLGSIVKHQQQQHNYSNTKSANTFTPRAIAKSYLVSPLLSLGQAFSAPDSRLKTKQQSARPHNSAASDLPIKVLPGQQQQQPLYATRDSINQPQSSDYKNRPHPGSSGQDNMSVASSSSTISIAAPAIAPKAASSNNQGTSSPMGANSANPGVGGWIKNGANHLAQNYLQDSFRDLLTLSQLPILSGGPVSTAPSDLEPGGKQWVAKKIANQQIRGNRTRAIDDMLRYAYILGSGVRRKRDPLKALGSSPSSNALTLTNQNSRIPSFTGLSSTFSHHSPLSSQLSNSPIASRFPLRFHSILSNKKIRPRGVMWDMATDPSLAVTVFHLLERASVALPLGFLLMPFVHMIRNPLNGINLGRIIPARASHRSVDYEELAKRLDMVDKLLSKALKSAHREASSLRR